ncbi:hypothetical protein, partial [Pantoea sp. ANP04]|uniref:hypothetical protein n=1 Tax=Pantoea sp. ANP04 TaxID=3064896 RepID=UPI0035C63435
MFQFVLAFAVAFVLFALVAEASTFWLIVVGTILACLFVISAMMLGYAWAQKKFQDDIEI